MKKRNYENPIVKVIDYEILEEISAAPELSGIDPAGYIDFEAEVFVNDVIR